MRITAELLIQLGAVFRDDSSYIIKSHGYEFIFYKLPGGEVWSFEGHHVTDLEECFGLIASKHYDFGNQAAKYELQDWLEYSYE